MSTASHASVSGWRHRAVAVHTRTEVLGLSLISGGILFVLAAALASGVPMGDAGFLVPFIIAPAVGAVLAWRFGTWGRSVGLALGIATTAVTWFLMFGIMVPASFVEFTTATAFILGVLLMLYGGIASIVRRADVREEPARTEVLLDRAALAVVLVAFLVSLPMWLLGRQTVDAAAASGLPEVTASNFTYEDVTAASGSELVVRNQDPFVHTFTVDALGIDVELLPGDSTIIELPAETGTFTFYCIPHSFEEGAAEDDMAATLTLE